MRAARSRDVETVFIVRVVMLSTLAGLLPVVVIAGLVKLAAPEYDAGELAFALGWPSGFMAAAAVGFARHRRHRALDV